MRITGPARLPNEYSGRNSSGGAVDPPCTTATRAEPVGHVRSGSGIRHDGTASVGACPGRSTAAGYLFTGACSPSPYAFTFTSASADAATTSSRRRPRRERLRAAPPRREAAGAPRRASASCLPWPSSSGVVDAERPGWLFWAFLYGAGG